MAHSPRDRAASVSRTKGSLTAIVSATPRMDGEYANLRSTKITFFSALSDAPLFSLFSSLLKALGEGILPPSMSEAPSKRALEAIRLRTL
jgi:hypothetical protein